MLVIIDHFWVNNYWGEETIEAGSTFFCAAPEFSSYTYVGGMA